MPFRWLSRKAIVFGIVVEFFSLSLLAGAFWVIDAYHPHNPPTALFMMPLTLGFLLNLFGFNVGALVMLFAYFLGVEMTDDLGMVSCGVAVIASMLFWAWSFDYWRQPRTSQRATKHRRQLKR